ncbi:hypothetical protein GB937_003434 [Aspergillus fischeri]|nr:hypothetical protein GB937_003434 [Aspergillus fischeri]
MVVMMVMVLVIRIMTGGYFAFRTTQRPSYGQTVNRDNQTIRSTRARWGKVRKKQPSIWDQENQGAERLEATSAEAPSGELRAPSGIQTAQWQATCCSCALVPGLSGETYAREVEHSSYDGRSKERKKRGSSEAQLELSQAGSQCPST